MLDGRFDQHFLELFAHSSDQAKGAPKDRIVSFAFAAVALAAVAAILLA